MITSRASQRLYLDYNATAPVRDGVKAKIPEFLDLVGNPSSTHSHGRFVRQCLEKSRTLLGEYLGVPARAVTLTSGATEANNIVLSQHKGPVCVSAVEHDSAYHVRSDAHVINVDDMGRVNLDHLDQTLRALSSDGLPPLVAMIIAHNETGVIQPMEDILRVCQKHDALLHIDGVQALGRMPVPLDHVYTMSLSGHKIGALSGVGALVKGAAAQRLADRQGLRDAHIVPLMQGGGQERGLRPGTENTLGILSLGCAISAMSLDDWNATRTLRDTFERELLYRIPNICIASHGAERLPNTSMIALPKTQDGRALSNDVQLIQLDQMGISVSSGSACSSGTVKISRTLRAMGWEDALAKSAIRISFPPGADANMLQTLLDAWYSLYQGQPSSHSPMISTLNP